MCFGKQKVEIKASSFPFETIVKWAVVFQTKKKKILQLGDKYC